MPQKKDKKFPCYVSEDHIHEIDDHVNAQKRAGKKGESGKPVNRNDYIRDALASYGKVTGLKTSPYTKK